MNVKQARFAIATAVAAMMLLCLAGCGGGKNFSPDDFKKIKKGMPEEQVKEILGSPKEDITASTGDARRLFWIVGDKYYSISFDKEKKVIEPLAHANREDYEMMRGLMKVKL